MTPLKNRAIQRLRRAFEDTFRYLRRKKVAGMPARSRLQYCPDIEKQRGKGDGRAFFHVGHKGDFCLCTVPESGELPDEHLYALLLHEFGHPLAQKWWGKSKQQDADKAIFEATGIPILYRSKLCLQWITPTDVRRVKSEARRGVPQPRK